MASLDGRNVHVVADGSDLVDVGEWNSKASVQAIKTYQSNVL